MCMWSIHDFPAYGLFTYCVTKRHVGCLPCSPTIESRSSRKLNKLLYYGSWRYLPRNHPYQKAWVAFNGEIELRATHVRVNVVDTMQWGIKQKSWL
jgi:hypothetical protein